jgi:hypothetical protein
MPRPALEVAQIFRRHGPDYRKNQRLSLVQPKARIIHEKDERPHSRRF